MLKKDILIKETESIRNALRVLEKTAKRVLLVVDGRSRLLGTVTDGDIRRYILSGKKIENNINKVYNRKPVYINEKEFSLERVKKVLIENKLDLIPILGKSKKVVGYKMWDEVFAETKREISAKKKLNIPVVIMAGGKGSRLEPFTRILPKALIPVGDKPITEIVIDEFRKQGINKFYLTLKHKAEMVEFYFNNVQKDYSLRYIKEKEFLGTAGSLRLIKNRIGKTFIVSNCDVIVKADFGDVLNFHKAQKASLTVLSPLQHYKLPYGIIKFKKGGEITDIAEKPEYTFTVNAGIYVLEREALKHMPEGKYFDMTDLMQKLIKSNKKIVIYPLNEKDYIDIGKWEEYKKSIEKLEI